MNLNLEIPAFLDCKISTKCHEQSEAQNLRLKIKSFCRSVYSPISIETSNYQIQTWNSQFVMEEICPFGTWKKAVKMSSLILN